MRATTSKTIGLFAAVSLLAACASVSESEGGDKPTELDGKVIARSFGSVQPGKPSRAPGIPLRDSALAPQVERSALPKPTYEHRVEIGPGKYIVVHSETDAYSVGTCVRVREYSSGKASRMVSSVQCDQQ